MCEEILISETELQNIEQANKLIESLGISGYKQACALVGKQIASALIFAHFKNKYPKMGGEMLRRTRAFDKVRVA